MAELITSVAEKARKDREMRNLLTDMAELIPYIEDKNVTDIAVGYQGQVIVEGFGIGKIYPPIIFDPQKTRRIIYALSSILDIPIDLNTRPVLEGILPQYNCRFEGLLPNRVPQPMIFIRRPPAKIFPLESYVEEGRLEQDQYDLILSYIRDRKNILVGGETGSGKTTFLNAIIDKMVEFTPDNRFYIVEDAGEIQCRARDIVPVFAQGKACLDAVGTSLRCNVSRIIFGELRYGDVTNELLKAWNSGHTGNCSTIHANSCASMNARVKSLLREVLPGELPNLSEYIHLYVHLSPSSNGPFIDEVQETQSLAADGFLDELTQNNLV